MVRTIDALAEPVHASLRGAGLFAGMALEEISLDEIEGMVPVDARYEPDPARTATYDRLYGEFPKLYRAQKSMFARLNSAPGPV